ncbi:hypothetical protein D9613_009699 [Agrocybe pediades]|uniref:Uncharacterized protein n=1 Tax=Agrocybe pediades TaxID=84607 RepID=A0A8H4VSY6_9AGAR|nr:hypothetical protein D9613_009699 [Agrocybe pediades]
MTPEATELLMEAASLGYHNLLAPTSIAIAGIIIDCLQKYLDISSDERDGDDITYNLLFYAASIYLSGVPKTSLPDPWTPTMLSLYGKLDEARIAVIRYKERVLDVVGPDHAIERRFVECNDFSSSWLDAPRPPRRFTAEWWNFLEVPFVYRAGEELRIGIGEEGMPIPTTSTIPDLPSTSTSNS